MKSWILIASYQWKDILKRWFETPGALFARVLIAAVLSLAMLWLHASFALATRSLEVRVERLGVNTVVVHAHRFPSDTSARPLFEHLLPVLREEGRLFCGQSPYVAAHTETGDEARLLVYSDSQRASLAEILGCTPSRGTILCDRRLPEGLPVGVVVDGLRVTAETCALPERLARAVNLRGAERLVLLPEVVGAPFLRQGFRDIAYFAADDPSKVKDIVASLRQLLAAEGYRSSDVLSAEKWLSELAELRTQQALFRRAAALFFAFLLVLVFGSISVLEYRQNMYIAALIRSFGIPPFVLVLRYLIEALLVVTAGAAIAWGCAIALHSEVFTFVGMETSLVQLETVDPYPLERNRLLLLSLAAGAALSVLPVVVAVRKSVGRILG